MKMKSQKPSEAAVKCREAAIAAFQPFKHQLTDMEILAVLAYSVGQAIAMQDQRTVTHEMIWELVGANIEAGKYDGYWRACREKRRYGLSNETEFG